MAVAGLTLLFTHDRKHDELDQWVDFSFSREMLRQTLNYYRLLGYAMAAADVLFVISLSPPPAPQASPSINCRFWTAAPAAPLPRLSRRATRTAWRRRSLANT